MLWQEYTDDTAELRRELDALGGMAALQNPESQLLALSELEQIVSAVGHTTLACLLCVVTPQGCVAFGSDFCRVCLSIVYHHFKGSRCIV